MITFAKDTIHIVKKGVDIQLPVSLIETYVVDCQIYDYPDEQFEVFKMDIKLRQGHKYPFDSLKIESNDISDIMGIQRCISKCIQDQNKMKAPEQTEA